MKRHEASNNNMQTAQNNTQINMISYLYVKSKATINIALQRKALSLLARGHGILCIGKSAATCVEVTSPEPPAQVEVRSLYRPSQSRCPPHGVQGVRHHRKMVGVCGIKAVGGTVLDCRRHRVSRHPRHRGPNAGTSHVMVLGIARPFAAEDAWQADVVVKSSAGDPSKGPGAEHLERNALRKNMQKGATRISRKALPPEWRELKPLLTSKLRKASHR